MNQYYKGDELSFVQEYKVKGTQTHQSLLNHFIPKTNKPILEVGMGLFSTPLICEVAGENLVVSLENNKDWYNQLQTLQGENRQMLYMHDYDNYDVTQHDWGVAFIDQLPKPHRAVMINKLANLADYVIAHDTDINPRCAATYIGMEAALSKFKYRFDHFLGIPCRTTVVSNKYELDLDGLALRYREGKI